MDNKKINELFSELAQLKAIAEETKKEIEKIETEIKTYMYEADLDELQGTEHKATYKEVEQVRLDSKLFKTQEPETFAKYSKTVCHKRFNFK